jgi:hypothetical protein
MFSMSFSNSGYVSPEYIINMVKYNLYSASSFKYFYSAV